LVSITVTKCLRESAEKEERFILVFGFGGYSPWSVAAFAFLARQYIIMAVQYIIIATEKQRER
jgi:hypothetical protein